MAQSLTITLDNDIDGADLLDNFCYGDGYVDQIANPNFDPELPEDPDTNPELIDNPITKKEYLRQWVIIQVKEGAKQRELNLADAAIRAKYDGMSIS